MIKDIQEGQQMIDMSSRSRFIKRHRTLLVNNNQKSISCLYMFGDTIYVGTRLSKLFVYQYENFGDKQPVVLTPHCDTVVSIVSQGKYFITVPEADEDNNLSVWNVKENNFKTNIEGHKSQVSGIIFLSDTNFLATSSWDGSVRIFNYSNMLNIESEEITAQYPVLAIEEINNQLIMFGGDDCYLSIWNWRKKQQVTKVFGHAGSVTYIYANLPFIITAGGDQKLKIWDFKKRQRLPTYEISDGMIEQESDVHIEDHYDLQLSREIKKFYDSAIFMTVLEKNRQYLFMDRHGQRFIVRDADKTVEIIPGENNFFYNDNITGIARPTKQLLLVSTSRGDLAQYEILPNESKMQQMQQAK